MEPNKKATDIKTWSIFALGWKLSRRVHDRGPEEVHQRHEEGLHQEAAQGLAEALLEATGLCLFRRHQQEVRHDHHGVHRS